jgi:hypothetical protein
MLHCSVCVGVYIHTYVYIHTHTHKHIHTHTLTSTRTYYTHRQAYVCVYIHTHTLTNTCTYYTRREEPRQRHYILSKIFTYTHTHTHTHILYAQGGAQTKALHFIENLHVIKDNLFEVPPLFKLIHKESGTDWKEMYKVLLCFVCVHVMYVCM